MDLTPIAPVVRSREWVMEKAEFMVNVRIWPLKNELDPGRWLSNFTEQECEVAVHLLDQFMYFGEEMLDAVFLSGFQRISMSMLDPLHPDKLNQRWEEFLSSVIVTPVQGEDDSIADSGRIFGRKARQVLGLTEDHLLEPYEASQVAINSGRPLVLVDDFVGTGQQTIVMWERLDLERVARSGVPIYYVPALSTKYGYDIILEKCKGLNLSPGQLIPYEYSATAEKSIVWPAGRAEEYLQTVKRASLRAGIPDTDGQSVDDWQGFHKLGLALAMHGSVPDATLALFRWEGNGWKPLVKRK